jgi:hypothetical protein
MKPTYPPGTVRFVFFGQIDAVARGMYGINVFVSALPSPTHRQTENPLPTV